jgi:DNA helicase HerA-like ATPase
VLLASQSPGDFDYRCRQNICNWFVGKVTQETALAKMRPMLREAKTDIAAKLPSLGAGQFFLVRESNVEALAANRSLIDAQQIPDADILRLAKG